MPIRKIWTQFQDKTLKYLKEDLNIQRWSLIAEKMENEFGIVGRNQKQCRQRYHNHLDFGLKSGKLSKDEEKLLFNLHNKLGNKWAEIASHFQGRTDSSLKNIFHSKLRKGIRKFNRTAKQIFNQNAKTYPLNILCTIMDNFSLKFESQNCKDDADSDFFKQIQNKLIEYGESSVLESRLEGKEKNKMFFHLKRMLSKIQQFQKPAITLEYDSISESSEYLPARKRRIQSGVILCTKVKQNEDNDLASIQRKSFLDNIQKIQKFKHSEVPEAQQEIILIRKKSVETETPLSEDLEAKSQNEQQDLFCNQQENNKRFEYEGLQLDDTFYENQMTNVHKNEETEIQYREISDSQCFQQDELFTSMIENDFDREALF